MVNTEIFAQAGNFKLTVKEVPIKHFHRTKGQATGANFFVILKAFRELFFMWQHLRHVKPGVKPGLFLEHGKVENTPISKNN